VAGIPTVAGTRDEQKTNSLAGYGQATYEIIPDTNLTLGGRYTYESKRFEGTQTFAVAGTVVSTTAFPDPSLGIPGNIDFRNFSYRVALDHKFSRDLLGYLSFNTGFKSGGFNTDVPSNVPYLPEKIGALEAGLKAEALDQRLRINTALYRYSYSNIQVARFIQGNEVLYNGARATLYGADTDAEVAVTEALLFSGGLAYNHARFAEFNNADFFAPVGTCVPAPGGTCPGNAAGKTLPYAPAFTFNVGANYKVLSPIGRLDFNATYFRSTRFYGHPDNIGVQPAYDLTNLSLTWTNLDEKLSLKGWTKNLGNTTYATSLVEAQQGLVRELGTPRTYGLTVGYKF
jgi:iron complex outermembrane receptor protein